MSATSPDDGQTSLKPALKTDDEGKSPVIVGTLKAVQIAEPEAAAVGDLSRNNSSSSKQFNAGLGSKRLSGRMSTPTLSSKTTLVNHSGEETSTSQAQPESHHSSQHTRHKNRHHATERLLAQVGEWLKHERKKVEHRKKHWSHRKSHKENVPQEGGEEEAESAGRSAQLLHRSDSFDSQSSDVSLDRLQRILEDNMAVLGLTNMPHLSPGLGHRRSSGHLRRHSARQLFQRSASSDTDYFDGDVVVPACDAVLDNSKTMGYSGGFASTDDLPTLMTKRGEKDRQAWLAFKNEIIRLAHTLKLKGWRSIPLESGDSISVERLSGALTNAVYVATPPEELPESAAGKKAPSKILLRIYGPQVEHLINREEELAVLKRLARKKIGPRLLGTFTNGRFEEYFNASALKPHDLRDPETSKQIAKRMRELHDGIELLKEEREAGPNVFRNWDRWLENVEKVVKALDDMIASGDTEPKGSRDAWKAKGYVCGVEWPKFKAMVEKHRESVISAYGSMDGINEAMVFAHNDTQYGNILRVRPDDTKSPLLQPANKHKQLIVIDFEYAAANTPGLEFANHFSEWCYDYHDALAPHRCRDTRFPSPEEQHRFVRSYVDHRPQFPLAGSTPRLTPLDSNTPNTTTPSLQPTASSSSIVEFMLDARASAYSSWREEERAREERSEEVVQKLLKEARLWRPANSAQWVAWGIIQAKVPGEGGEEAELESDEFDYLCYAQDRAHLFWGDCLQLGLVTEEELPQQLRGLVKILNR